MTRDGVTQAIHDPRFQVTGSRDHSHPSLSPAGGPSPTVTESVIVTVQRSMLDGVDAGAAPMPPHHQNLSKSFISLLSLHIVF
jgi:hypothetical protein